MNLIKLPKTKPSPGQPLEQLLARRRCVRDYADRPVTLAIAACLLRAAPGVTDPPSAGTFYPLAIYLAADAVTGLLPGSYRYLPHEGAIACVLEGDRRAALAAAALGQSWLADAAHTLVFATHYRLTTLKYGRRGIRYVHAEAGHAAQNILLMTVALNLGAAVVGAFGNERVASVMGIAGEETPLYLVSVGASGMNDRDCIALLQWVLPRLNHRWEGYHRVRRQVCRRIAARMQALGLADVDAYRARLEPDAAEWTALRSCLKVTVSRFFRDRGVFHALSHSIFPALAEMALKSGADTLRAWSVGCASGEEPCSLSLLWVFDLQERWPQLRLSILATDIDAGVLRRAQMACYPASSLREIPPDWVGPGFMRDNGRFCLRPALRAPVRFLRQDLCEVLPDDSFHLILCRNLAFTCFAEPLQQEIARDLLERLIPGGYLILGAHECLPAGNGSITARGEAAGIYWKTASEAAAAKEDVPAAMAQRE